MQDGEVCPVARTWNADFAMTPDTLVRVSGGVVTDLKRHSRHILYQSCLMTSHDRSRESLVSAEKLGAQSSKL